MVRGSDVHVPAGNGEVDDAGATLRALEARVDAHERFLESIFENIPDMIFVKDAKELRFVRFNRAAEALLGYRREDLLGRSDDDFFPPDEARAFTRKDREVLAGRVVVDIAEEPIHTRHLGTRYLHTKKIPVLGADGAPEYLLGISEDITERRMALEALARRTEELARSNRDLEDFAAVASHDLQEPLRSMMSFGDLLATALGPALDGEAAEHLARMQSAARRMQSLVQGMLQLARASTRDKHVAPVSLDAVMRDVLDDLATLLRETGARVDVGPLPMLDADPLQMRQLLQNLVGNAVKFRRVGVPPEVTVRGNDRSAPRCVITVRDRGIGFDPKHTDKIFRPFQRLHGASAYEGTGIGLTLCRRIAERHGGSITATSAPGEGATFEVTLPWRQPEEHPTLRPPGP